MCGRRVEHQAAMARVKRSPKMTANCAHDPLTRAHLPRLLGAVQDQVEQLQRGLVGREVAPGAHGPAQRGVQGLDGVRGVQDSPDLARERVERDDFAPGPSPTLSDGRVLPAPFARLEGRQGRLAGGGIEGAVDVLQRRRHGLAVLVGDEVQAVTQEVDDAYVDGLPLTRHSGRLGLIACLHMSGL